MKQSAQEAVDRVDFSITPEAKASYSITWTGKRFHPFDPDPADICIEDIARGLSAIPRFCGQTNVRYSVAWHSLLMVGEVPIELRLWALLHDSSEAYLNDVPSPVKKFLPDYKAVEELVMRAVAERFGLSWPMPDEIHAADERCIAIEKPLYVSGADYGAFDPPRMWMGKDDEEVFIRAYKEYSII